MARPRRAAYLVGGVLLLLVVATFSAMLVVLHSAEPADPANAGSVTRSKSKYDAVLVLGGGLEADGQPHPWVKERLDAAAAASAETFVVLSRGTTHKPPPLDADGFPIDEATASAKYLLHRHNIPAHRIVADTWSLDTIGNAYFAAAMVCGPMQHRKLLDITWSWSRGQRAQSEAPWHGVTQRVATTVSTLIVTSDSHLARARAIFSWIFPLWSADFVLSYQGTLDRGLAPDMLAARLDKENRAVKGVQHLAHRLRTRAQVTDFVFREHQAYLATGRNKLTAEDAALKKTY